MWRRARAAGAVTTAATAVAAVTVAIVATGGDGGGHGAGGKRQRGGLLRYGWASKWPLAHPRMGAPECPECLQIFAPLRKQPRSFGISNFSLHPAHIQSYPRRALCVAVVSLLIR